MLHTSLMNPCSASVSTSSPLPPFPALAVRPRRCTYWFESDGKPTYVEWMRRGGGARRRSQHKNIAALPPPPPPWSRCIGRPREQHRQARTIRGTLQSPLLLAATAVCRPRCHVRTALGLIALALRLVLLRKTSRASRQAGRYGVPQQHPFSSPGPDGHQTAACITC